MGYLLWSNSNFSSSGECVVVTIPYLGQMDYGSLVCRAVNSFCVSVSGLLLCSSKLGL